MIERIRWGILSTANIGRRRVIPAIQASANGIAYAVASRDAEQARALAGELGIPQAYGSYEALIADPQVDAVYIPLPNHLHAEWAIRCAEAGKPVLCEKPLASDAAEAQRMVEAFAARGVPLAEAFMYRFHPRMDRVRALLAEGAIGELRLIRATFSFTVTREDNIRLRRDMAGGALMDVGCYCVNVIRTLTGEEPVSVTAQATFGERSGVDEVLAGTLRFPSGVIGVLDCSLRVPRWQTYEVRGTHGQIVIDEAFGPEQGTRIQLWRGEPPEEIIVPGADQYQLMVEDFADALLKGRPPRFPASDAVATLRVIDRLLEEARSRG